MTSTYTYILLFFGAAAFVAWISRPRGRGEVVKKLYAGELLYEGTMPASPILRVKCLGGGKVEFERIGVDSLTSSGAVSLAVEFKGKDVEVKERVTAGYRDDPAAIGARFVVDMTGHEWRHVKWIDEDSGLWCAFSLHVREGISFEVALKR